MSKSDVETYVPATSTPRLIRGLSAASVVLIVSFVHSLVDFTPPDFSQIRDVFAVGVLSALIFAYIISMPALCLGSHAARKYLRVAGFILGASNYTLGNGGLSHPYILTIAAAVTCICCALVCWNDLAPKYYAFT